MTVTDFVDLVCSENQIKEKQIVISNVIPETHEELRELRLKDAIFYSNTEKEYVYHGIEKIKGGYDVAVFIALGKVPRNIRLPYYNLVEFFKRVEYVEEIKDIIGYLSSKELIKVHEFCTLKKATETKRMSKEVTAKIEYKGVMYNLSQTKMY